MLNTEEILHRLHDLRVQKGLKQEEVAGHLKVDRTTYLRKEKGHIPITTEEWLLLARLLGVSPSIFFISSNKTTTTDGLGKNEKTLISLYKALSKDERRELLFSIRLILRGVTSKEVRQILDELV